MLLVDRPIDLKLRVLEIIQALHFLQITYFVPLRIYFKNLDWSVTTIILLILARRKCATSETGYINLANIIKLIK